jgi:hypothetical protein
MAHTKLENKLKKILGIKSTVEIPPEQKQYKKWMKWMTHNLKGIGTGKYYELFRFNDLF